MRRLEANFLLRDYGTKVYKILEAADWADREWVARELRSASQCLIDKPDLLAAGVKRSANHFSNSKWLYFDGHLQVTLTECDKGKQIPVHDHGCAEACIVYSGRMLHTLWERVDDGSKEGYAELRKLDERELRRGDVVVVAPPCDIHSFVALEDNTFEIAVIDGPYSPTRHYYKPDQHTYAVQTPKSLGLGDVRR